MNLRPLTLLLLLLLASVAACTGDSAGTTTSATGTESDTSSSSSSTTAASETSSSTTDASGTMTDSGTSTSTTSTTDATSSTTADTTTGTTADTTTGTTGDTTGGGSDVCDMFCGHITECAGQADPMCLTDCAEYYGIFHGIGPICGAAIDEYLQCGAGLSCLEFGAFLNGDSTSCDDALAKVDGDPPACINEEATPAFCTAFCDKADMCKVAEPTCLDECKQGYLFGNAMDPACGSAVDAYYSCLGALTCQQLMNPVTCLDEATEVEAICMF